MNFLVSPFPWCPILVLLLQVASFPHSHHPAISRVTSILLTKPPTFQNQSNPRLGGNPSHSSSVYPQMKILHIDRSNRYDGWPEFPYRYDIPHTQETQWIQFTGPTPRHHGPRATSLLIHLCSEMIDWLHSQEPGSDVKESHEEHDGVVDGGGLSHSISLFLGPVVGDRGPRLSIRLALDVMYAFKALVRLYGALNGGFEIWQFGNFKGVCKIYIMEWPPARAVGTQ